MQQPTRLTRTAINKLIEQFPGGLAVTIYIPLENAANPPAMTENQIRIKNLCKAAMEQLGDTAREQQVQATIQKQMDELLEGIVHAHNISKGLLICADETQLQVFALPVDTEEYVAVADTFHLAQIFGLLEDAEQHYVLALAQHNPIIFEGTAYDLQKAAITLPASLEVALNIDESNGKTEQQRSAEGGRNHSYNGRGGAKSPAEGDRQKFWRMIDRALSTHADTSRPLLLAGTEKDIAEFKAITKYPKLFEGTVQGNFDEAQVSELLAHAAPIIESEITLVRHEQARATFSRMEGEQPSLVANELSDIANAAQNGKVDRLLIAALRRTTDTVRDSVEQAIVLSFDASQKINLALQAAAMAVWQTGGSITSLELSQMPRRGSYALATLRY